MDVKPCGGCSSPKMEDNGRSIKAGPCLHRIRHPEDVEGCFGCKACSQSVSLPGHASSRGDGISIASSLKVEHQERAKREPYLVPVKSRAYIT